MTRQLDVARGGTMMAGSKPGPRTPSAEFDLYVLDDAAAARDQAAEALERLAARNPDGSEWIVAEAVSTREAAARARAMAAEIRSHLALTRNTVDLTGWPPVDATTQLGEASRDNRAERQGDQGIPANLATDVTRIS